MKPNEYVGPVRFLCRTENTYVGALAGGQAQFVGTPADYGTNNTFVGYQAGSLNGYGSDNTFVGANAGQYNSYHTLGLNGYANSYFGYAAGTVNQTGNYNTFLGACLSNHSVACCFA